MTSLTRRLSTGIAAACLVTLALGSAPQAGAAAPAGSAGQVGRNDACGAPIGVACAFDLPYGNGPSQTLDAYWSTLTAGEPSVILIHGGGWMAGSSRDFYPEAVYFAQNGFAVFSINYTLSTPGNPIWPQVFDDVETAAGWVRAHARDFGADGTRLAALGSSAGAHLAALLDTAGPEDGHPLLAAVSWSGPMDLALTYQDGDSYVQSAIEQLLGCVPGSCGGADVAASPDSHVTPDDGALLNFNSRRELVPIRQARVMNRALRSAHVPSGLVVLRHTHAHASEFECYDETVLGQTGPVIDDTLRWISSYLTGRAIVPTGTYCP